MILPGLHPWEVGIFRFDPWQYLQQRRRSWSRPRLCCLGVTPSFVGTPAALGWPFSQQPGS